MDICKLSRILADNRDVRDSGIDFEAFCDFIGDFMKAEADAIEAKEPYATKTINALRNASDYIRSCGHDIEDAVEIITTYEPDEKPFTTVNPWDAPGMRVRDFL
jgi:hypothetical protein